MINPRVVWGNKEEIVRLSVGVYNDCGCRRICYLFDEREAPKDKPFQIRISCFDFDKSDAACGCGDYSIDRIDAGTYFDMEKLVEMVHTGKLPEKAIAIAMELLL